MAPSRHTSCGDPGVPVTAGSGRKNDNFRASSPVSGRESDTRGCLPTLADACGRGARISRQLPDLQTPTKKREPFCYASGTKPNNNNTNANKQETRNKNNNNYFTSNIPTLSWQRYSGVGQHSGVAYSKETLGLGTPGRPWGWARETLGTPGTLWVGHSRETLGLGTPGRFWGWVLRGHSGLGTLGRLWGWALQGHSVGHSRDTWGWALQG